MRKSVKKQAKKAVKKQVVEIWKASCNPHYALKFISHGMAKESIACKAKYFKTMKCRDAFLSRKKQENRNAMCENALNA